MKSQTKKSIAILGAGITGLVSAYYLSKDYDVIVFEKEPFVGGTARSFEHNGFTLDYGPHKLYSELPGIIDEMNKVCPLIKVRKKNSIFINGKFYDFPLKLSQIAAKMPLTALKAGTDILFKPFSRLPDDSYENYLLNRFGKTLYGLSFRDYALKVWGTSPWELDRELAKRRVAISGIFELIKGILFKDTKKISAEYFYYPEKGMKQLFDILVKKIRENGGRIFLQSEISKINLKDNKIDSILVGKTKIKPDYIISTIPLDSLSELIYPKSSYSAEGLSYKKLNILYIILNKERALKDCWIFFPEKKIIFQRLSEQKAFSPNTSPKDKTCLMVETTRELDESTINAMILQLESIGILKKEEISEHFTKSINKAYPVYKKGFSENLRKFTDFIESIDGFYLLGRQGLFNYNNMDQCWDMSMKIAEQIRSNKSKEEWKKTKEYFESYRIVD